MAYIPQSNSVVGFQSDPSKLNTTAYQLAGSIMAVNATLTPAANQSVSGTVGASVIGTVPVTQSGTWTTSVVGGVSILGGGVAVTNFPTSQNISGSVFATGSVATLQGTNPWIVQTAGSVLNQYKEDVSATSVVGNAVIFRSNDSSSLMSLVSPAKPLPIVGSVSGSVGISNFPTTQNVSGSVFATGSVTALQGTNPWFVQLTSGSVITTGANSSVMLTQGTNTIGSVTAIQGTNPYVMTGSIQGTVSVLGTVPVTQSTSPWVVVPTSGSILVGNQSTGVSSVQLMAGTNIAGSIATLQGTNPWMVQLTSGSVITSGGNSSVMLMPGQNTIGSVAVLQGTNPWTVTGFPTTQNVSGSVFATGSITALQGTNPWTVTGFPTTQNISGSVYATGSITALQGTNPWLVQTTGSVLNQYREDTASTSIVGNAMLFRNNDATSMMAVVGPLHPLPIVGSVVNSGGITSVTQSGQWNMSPASVQVMAGTNNIGSVTAIQGTNPWVTLVTGSVATTWPSTSLVSGHASTVGSASSSVLVIASVQSTLYTYVTDFAISNTGATTTLVTFTDSDGSVMGKSIAPTGGGAVMSGIASPMRTASTGKAVYVGATTATSTLHAWVGGYKA